MTAAELTALRERQRINQQAREWKRQARRVEEGKIIYRLLYLFIYLLYHF